MKAAKKTREEVAPAPTADGAVEVAFVEPEPKSEPEPPPVAAEAKEDDPPKGKPEKPDKVPNDLKLIRQEEERSLREFMQGLGNDGAFRVQITRSSPEQVWDNARQRNVKTKGHLGTLEEHTLLDEEYLAREYGGGTYRLKITRKTLTGSHVFVGHRTVEVAGDPRLDRLPLSSPPQAAAPAPAQAAESPAVQIEAMKMVKEAYQERGAQRGMDPAVQMLFEQMRALSEQQARELSELRSQLVAAQNRKPAEDPFREKLVNSLFEGETAMTARLREAHAAEIRTLKEGFAQERALIEARHDRLLSDLKASNERAMEGMRASFEREIKALSNTHEVALMSAKTTADVLKASLESENRRLERENTEQRAELKELRASAKDEKDVLSQLKKMKELQEAFGAGEEKDSSTFDKVAEVMPALVEGVGTIIGNVRGQAASAAAPGAQPRIAAVASPKGAGHAPGIYRDNTGQLVKVGADGQPRPVTRKPKAITTDDGREVPAPTLDPDTAKKLVAYLESAYNGGTDPAVVVRSATAVIPPDIIQWIRNNDTDQVSGVDLFMRRVVNLSSSSPLSSQAGRKWLRELGKALIEGT